MAVRTDRFGNPFVVCGMSENKNGFPVGYERIGGKLYKFDLSPARGDSSKSKQYRYWLRITELDERQARASSFDRAARRSRGGL